MGHLETSSSIYPSPNSSRQSGGKSVNVDHLDRSPPSARSPSAIKFAPDRPDWLAVENRKKKSKYEKENTIKGNKKTKEKKGGDRALRFRASPPTHHPTSSSFLPLIPARSDSFLLPNCCLVDLIQCRRTVGARSRRHVV